MRLAYFHTNCLLIELWQQETEIRCRKHYVPIKKQTDIDHHGPVPYSISSQTPDPPHFSLPTTFKEAQESIPPAHVAWRRLVRQPYTYSVPSPNN